MDLLTELAKPEYADLSHEDAAALVNSSVPDVDVPAPIRSILAYLELTGLMDAIVTKSGDQDVSGQACRSFVRISNNVNFSDLDLTNPGISGLLDAMVSGQVLTEQNKAVVLSMGKAPGRKYTAGEVQAARLQL